MRLPTILVLGAIALAAAGCSGERISSAAGRSRLDIAERDFKITAPKRMRAGDVDLTVDNKGPDTHELIVVRAGTGELPLRVDGLTVNEESLEGSIVTTVEGFGPGEERRVRLHLRPGRYELLCNMAGHYLGGMHAELVVQ